MTYSFDRGLPIRQSLLAVLLMTMACLSTARADPQTPDVTVTAASPPTAQELAGDGLSQFVVHHATVHYVNTGTEGNLARWRGGLQSICPLTAGLSPGYDAFVTARLRALATYVGAPVESDPKCKTNVQIIFTTNPEASMDGVFKWATVYFRNRYSGGMRNLIKFRSDHAIQGWYMTTSGGSIVLNSDVGLVHLNVLPVWPQITQNYISSNYLGSRVSGGSGSGSGIGIVILIVDTLKALYYHNTGLGPSLSRDEIQSNMLRQFNDH
jgi:hypothetical protein